MFRWMSVGRFSGCTLDVPWKVPGGPLDVPWKAPGGPLDTPLEGPWKTPGAPLDTPLDTPLEDLKLFHFLSFFSDFVAF